MEPSLSFTSTISRCEYLPDRQWRLKYEICPDMGPQDYQDRLQAGWRRFGPVVFRPECPSCRMCQSLRVPAATFRPSQSQRRAVKRNEDDVTIRIGSPSPSREKLDLLTKFHRFGHETKGWPARTDIDLQLLAANPFPTEEWCYFVGDRLVGVGYVDALPQGLSAIYFFHDPAERHRSLGTFNIVAIVASARERGVPYAYLGYYVAGCRSLEYKGRFRPCEVLTTGGEWQAFQS